MDVDLILAPETAEISDASGADTNGDEDKHVPCSYADSDCVLEDTAVSSEATYYLATWLRRFGASAVDVHANGNCRFVALYAAAVDVGEGG